MKKYAFLAALTVVGVANAQLTPQVAPKDLREATPDKVARISADGRLLTPWVNLRKGNGSGAGAEVPNWVLAHDNIAWDLATNAINVTTYRNPVAPRFTFNNGTSAGSSRANWPNMVNDTVLHSSAAVGQFVQRQRWILQWNPAGKPFDVPFVTTTPTNPRTALIAFFPVSVFGFGGTTVFAGATDGLIWQATNLGEGNWSFSGVLTSDNTVTGTPLGFGLPMPASQTNGGYLVQVFTLDANNAIIPLPAPGTSNLFWQSPMSATDPFQTGTNPSDSTQFAWVDANANGSFSTAEYLNQQFTTGTNPGGNLSPTTGWAYDSNNPTTTGTVTYSNLNAPPIGQPSSQLFNIIAVDAAGNRILNGGNPIFDSVTVSISSTGEYRLLWPRLLDPNLGNLTINTYKIQVKGRTWLRATSGVIDMSLGATGVNFVLINGDVNNDNIIDGLDLGAMDVSFNLALGETGFNADADLNKDDVVDGLDLGILDANFNTGGDDDLTLP